MFGHKWEHAEATIIAIHQKAAIGDPEGSRTRFEFAADVRPADGEPFRAMLKDKMLGNTFRIPAVGEIVPVLVDVKDGKAKFDFDDPRLNLQAKRKGQEAEFEAVMNAAPGTSASPAAPPAAGAVPADLAAMVEALRGAGQAPGQAGPVVVPLAGDPAEQIKALMETLGGASRQVAPDDASGVAGRIATLDSLRQAGVLSDDEYAAQRQRILDEI